MDMRFQYLRAINICVAIVIAGAFGLTGCAGSEGSTDEGTSTAPPSDGTETNDGAASDSTAQPEGATADGEGQSETEDPQSGGSDDEAAEEFLTRVQSAAQPLGDVIGASRPVGLQPITVRADSYPRLCPADDLPVDAVLQEDPLLENLPVQRYIVAFLTADGAAAFFADLASTEVGCIGERVSEVSTGTTTITDVSPFDAVEGLEAVRISASIAVDLINFDQDPPAADVIRSVAIEGSSVIIVVSIAGYGSAIGVAEVHAPLLADGAELVRAAE